MSTRKERTEGKLATGEMNGRRLSEHLGVPHGTIKRWLYEGMPSRRHGEHGVWIDPEAATKWLAERFKGKTTIAFARRGFIYFMEREDGAIKIGWSSDVMRRVSEVRKDQRSTVTLLVCYPGDKPDELRLHSRFSSARIVDEWFHPTTELLDLINGLKKAA